MTKKRQSSHAKRVALERRLKEIRSQETTIKERIYKLEASIAATPGMVSERRLRLWNTVPAETVPLRPRTKKPTRWQRSLDRRARSRQALGALGMIIVAALLAVWLAYQLQSSGLL